MNSPFGDIKLLIPRHIAKDNVEHVLNDDKFHEYVYSVPVQSGSAASIRNRDFDDRQLFFYNGSLIKTDHLDILLDEFRNNSKVFGNASQVSVLMRYNFMKCCRYLENCCIS